MVDKMDFHLGLKDASCHFDVTQLQTLHEIFVQTASVFGSGSMVKARTAAFSAVTIQSELGDYQQRASGIQYAAIHTACIVREDAELDDFRGQVIGVLASICVRDAKKDQQSMANGSHRFAGHVNVCAGDALQDDSHAIKALVWHSPT